MKLFLLSILLPLAVFADDVRTGIVTADQLNVRPKPGIHYQILCTLPRNSEVVVLKEVEQWYGIQCPATAQAWVPAAKVGTDNFASHRTPVYAGAGTLYATFATIKKGEPVKIVERRDKWIRIAPPEVVVWVHGSYVEIPDDEPPPVAAEEPREQRPPEFIESTPPAPEKLKVHRILPRPQSGELTFIGDAKQVAKAGLVIPLAEEGTPWAHAIAVNVNDTYYPLAYLKGATVDFTAWEWHSVHVNGTQRWVKGWPRPIIDVAEIKARK